MKHELALRLGRTIAEIELSMSLQEFMDWLAWDSVSPIGDERCYDIGPSRIMQTQIAAAGKKPPELVSLLPFRERKVQTLEEFITGLLKDGTASS